MKLNEKRNKKAEELIKSLKKKRITVIEIEKILNRAWYLIHKINTK